MTDEVSQLAQHEETILSTLQRSSTALANVDPGASLLFLLSTIIPEFTLGVLWKKQGGDYRRAYITTSEEDYQEHVNVFRRTFASARLNGAERNPDVLRVKRPIKNIICRPIEPFNITTRFGANLTADHLILLPLRSRSGKEELVEVYCRDEVPAGQLNRIEDAANNVCDCLNARLIRIYKVLEANEEGFSDFRELQGNRRLFRQIFRDMRTWLGEELQAVNIFAYDPRDRLLYHLETSHLEINQEALKKYKPTQELASPDIVNRIRENIERRNWLGDINPDALKEMLNALTDRKRVSKAVKNDGARLLKALLTVMPQEPGTGVAGETALTRLPQLGLNTDDPRWQGETATYRDTFFAAMLPVEQIFGIGSSGNKMAAVPLMESGQLWGVLFLSKQEEFTGLNLLALWEKAQHLSSVLTLFRTFQFQHSILRGAKDNPHTPIAALAMKNLHLAVNPIFAVHWQLRKDGHDRVERWEFDPATRRFGPGDAIDTRKKPFNDSVIKTEVHKRIKNNRMEIIEFSENEAKTGLPADVEFEHRELVRSVMMVPAPPNDLLAIYLDEDVKNLKPFLSQFEERFSCLWDIYDIRKDNKLDDVIVTQSKEMIAQLNKAFRIVQSQRDKKVNIMLRGENGTGKELLAKRIHALSGRRGEMITVVMNTINEELMASELFGSVEGAFTGAKNKPGFATLAHGGTLFLDEIGNLSLKMQMKLLRFIQERTFYPVGGREELKTDVLLVTATNKPLEEMVKEEKFGEDLYYRLEMFRLTLPALRERREDISLLARYFLNREFSGRDLKLSAEVMAAMLNFDWPGNVRQLLNFIVDSVSNLEDRNVITLGDISRREIQQATGPVRALNVARYVGLADEEDDGCRGWALFTEDEIYDVDGESPEDDWTHATLSAFRRLEESGVKVSSYCSMGCGAALDAVMAVNLWDCQRVQLADVNENAQAIAQENVTLNAEGTVVVNFVAGNLFQNFPQEKFDLIYENLPNLPWTQEGTPGGIKLATFSQRFKDNSDLAERWLLTSHEQFLKQAKPFLEPGGRVLCCIGARVRWEVVVELFKSQGYAPELIYFGIKKQQQVLEVVEGYAKAEELGGATFTFLDLNAARALEAQMGSHAPEDLRRLLESEDSREVRLTAREAREELLKEGRKIGHGVYVVAGQLK